MFTLALILLLFLSFFLLLLHLFYSSCCYSSAFFHTLMFLLLLASCLNQRTTAYTNANPRTTANTNVNQRTTACAYKQSGHASIEGKRGRHKFCLQHPKSIVPVNVSKQKEHGHCAKHPCDSIHDDQKEDARSTRRLDDTTWNVHVHHCKISIRQA